MRRRYDKEFKLNALGLLKEGKTGTEICRSLGIPDATFWSWIAVYEEQGEDGFSGSGNIRESEKDIVALKKALADARLERDILKKALAIFSKER